MTEENKVIPYLGGAVECAAAMTFQGQNRDTGAPQEVNLPNRIVVSFGRKKATLCGSMVKGLVETYKKDPDFRAWCDTCG